MTRVGLERNVRLYPWYAGLTGCYFWLPVFFLFFQSKFGLAEVLRLEAIYYLAVVLLEVPSGYFSDRIGRRPTLLISAVALAISYAMFTLADGFAAFAAAQVALAAAIAFRSGTDTSLHYDSLASLGREMEYTEREAVAEHWGFTAGALSAFAGGLIASINLSYAYALSFVTALGALGVAWRFAEPQRGAEARAEQPLAQIARCLGLLRQGALAWLFAFAVLMVILNHIPYEFTQPYLEEIMGLFELEARTPAVTGAVGAITMLVAARAAMISPRMDRRFGTARTLLTATVLQGVIILVMAFVLHPVVAVLILLRSVPGGLAAAPLRGAIVPRVGSGQRATYLSIQSLVGRASFSATLAGLSLIGGTPQGDWSDMQQMLKVAAIIAGSGFIVLCLTARAVRD